MKTRILSALVLAPAFVAVLIVAPKIMTALVFCFLCAFSAYELLYGTGLVRHPRLVAYSMILAFCVPLWCYYGSPQTWAQAALLAFFALLFMEMMLSHIKLRLELVCYCFLGALVIPYMLCGIVRVFMYAQGRFLVFIPFVAAFLSDTGAYFIGCKFGRHKLAPVISPKKSIEGFFAGLVTAVLGMLLYGLILQIAFERSVNYGNAALVGLLGALAGVFGDLCFSVIKRQTGIKDYGNLIPGHGGVLDRFDSVVLAAPAVELLLYYLPVLVM